METNPAAKPSASQMRPVPAGSRADNLGYSPRAEARLPAGAGRSGRRKRVLRRRLSCRPRCWQEADTPGGPTSAQGSTQGCRLAHRGRRPLAGGGAAFAAGLFGGRYLVASSRWPSQRRACSRVSPHMSGLGWSEPQTAGRSGRPKIRQRSCSSSCTQGTPAGLPFGWPGMGELMDGAMQQAAQPGRQFMGRYYRPANSLGPAPLTRPGACGEMLW